jgi:hypothetical protein
MNDAPETQDLKKTPEQLAQANKELVETIRRRIGAGGKLLALAIAAGIAATILLLANFP